MSCSYGRLVAHGSDLSKIRFCPHGFSATQSHTERIPPGFQDVADPIQEFPCNLDDCLGFAHPLAILIEGLHKRRVLTHSNPGGFYKQPPQVRMVPLGHPSCMFFLPTALSIGNQSYVTAQLIDRRKPRNLTQFNNKIMAVKVLIPGNGSQQAHPRTVLFRSDKARMARFNLARICRR